MTYVHKPSMKQWLSTQPLPYAVKMRRAEAQLQSLRDAVTTFVRHNPCQVGEDVREEAGMWRTWYADVDRYPPVYEWGVQIGEFIHNVRSALDSLAYTLVACSTGRTPKGTEFPIFKDESKYLREGVKRIPGVPDDAAAYQRGKDFRSHPLWMLYELSNWDKHNIVTICTWGVRDPQFEVVAAPDQTLVHIERTIQNCQPVEHGTILAEAVFATSEAGRKADVRQKFEFDVVFFPEGPAGQGLIPDRLAEIFSCVREDVFKRLEPILWREAANHWPDREATGYTIEGEVKGDITLT